MRADFRKMHIQRRSSLKNATINTKKILSIYRIYTPWTSTVNVIVNVIAVYLNELYHIE